MAPRDSTFSTYSRVDRHVVMLVGDAGVGKSSIIESLQQCQSPGRLKNVTEVKPTVGVDCVDIDVGVFQREAVPLRIFDASGNRRYSPLLSMYLKDAQYIITVCDVSCPSSFDSVPMWLSSIRTNNNHAQICILATKTDVADRAMTSEEVRGLCIDQKSPAPSAANVSIVAECSGKTGKGIHRVFSLIAQKLAGSTESQAPTFLMDDPPRCHVPCVFPTCPRFRKKRDDIAPSALDGVEMV